MDALRIALTALAFAVMVFFIVRPRHVRIPGTKRKAALDYATGSIIGALIIILSGTLSPQGAISSLLGRPGFEPATMIVLFMTVAYIAISLDSTGFFEYVAIKIVMRSGGSGKRLFFFFYCLSGVMTVFTSNDIVILTLTPIIFYFAKHAKVKALPYLIAEFFAANTLSMALFIGNPTNIIAGTASGIGFAQYSYWMIMPTIAAGIACLGLLYAVFRKDIAVKFSPPKELDAGKFLQNRMCAFVAFSMLCLTIVTLSVSESIGLQMWEVCLFYAILLFTYDAAIALREYRDKGLTFFRTMQKMEEKGTKERQFRLPVIAERMPWKIAPFLFCSFIMVEGLVAGGATDAAASFISSVSGNVFSAVMWMGFLSALAANLMNNQPMTVLFTKITESGNFALSGNLALASVLALIIGSNLGANLTLIGALAGIMWAGILRGKGEKVSYGRFAKIGFLVTPLVLASACIVLALEFVLFG